MELIGDLAAGVRSVALMPAAFHPPTRAHEALLRAALGHCDVALAVLARALPHKDYGAVDLERRIELLQPLLGDRIAAAVTEGGLFLEIAREARAQFPEAQVSLVCGRDAAERIVAWRYEGMPGIGEQLREFRLLVAARAGAYEPPPDLAHAVAALVLPPECDGISSTLVRQRIAAGEEWEHLVPAASVEAIRRVYSPLLFSRNARSL